MRTFLLTGLVVSLALPLAACGDDTDPVAEPTTTAAPRVLSGYQTDPPLDVSGLALPEASNGGEQFELVAQPGKLLVVYFGYTHCPDVCPTTLYDLKKALEQMGDQAALVDVSMGTIDPERDTDEVMTGYLQSFVPAGHALRTTDQDLLKSVTGAFGASYSVTPAADGGEPEVGHSPFVYIVDENAHVVLTWPFGLPSDAMAIDLEILLESIGAEA